MSEQKTQETAQLRAAMDALVQEAGHRTRKEVHTHTISECATWILSIRSMPFEKSTTKTLTKWQWKYTS